MHMLSFAPTRTGDFITYAVRPGRNKSRDVKPSIIKEALSLKSRQHVPSSQRQQFGADGIAGQSKDGSVQELQASLALGLGVPASALQQMVVRQPQLLKMSPTLLQARLTQLAAALQVPVEQAVSMVTRQPAVLSITPSMILEKCNHMEARLGLPQGGMRPLMARQPEFLEVSSERLALKCSQLSGCLGVSPGEAAAALTRLQPSYFLDVMGLRGDDVLMRLRQLEEMMQVHGPVPGSEPLPDDPTINDEGRMVMQPVLLRYPIPSPTPPNKQQQQQQQQWSQQQQQQQQQAPVMSRRKAARVLQAAVDAASSVPRGPRCAVRLVLQCPALLVVPLGELRGSYSTLLNLLQVPPARLAALLVREPALLLVPGASLQANAACLRGVLHLHGAQLASRLRQQPTLLKYQPQDITLRMEALAAALCVGASQVCRMIRNQPQLLVMSAGSLAAKAARLALLLGVPAEAVRAAVVRSPALLTLSEASMATKLSALSAVLGRRPAQQAPAAGDATRAGAWRGTEARAGTEGAAGTKGPAWTEGAAGTMRAPQAGVRIAHQSGLAGLQDLGQAGDTQQVTDQEVAGMQHSASNVVVRQELDSDQAAAHGSSSSSGQGGGRRSSSSNSSSSSSSNSSSMEGSQHEPTPFNITMIGPGTTTSGWGPGSSDSSSAPSHAVVAVADMSTDTYQLGSSYSGTSDHHKAVHLPDVASAGSHHEAADPAISALTVTAGQALVSRQVARAVLEQPILVTMSSNTLHLKMRSLSELLMLDPGRTQELVLQHPLLLAAPTANLQYRVQEVALVLGLRQRTARALLAAEAPLVLQTPLPLLGAALEHALQQVQPTQRVRQQQQQARGAGGTVPSKLDRVVSVLLRDEDAAAAEYWGMVHAYVDNAKQEPDA